MRRAWMVYSLLLGFLVLTHTSAFAQDSSSDTAAQQAQRELDARRSLELQRQSQKALNDFINGIRVSGGNSSRGGMSNGGTSLFYQFRMAIPKFRAATDEYRWVLSMEEKLSKPAKEIGNQADVMIDYLRSAKVNQPKLDPLEFKDYTPAELQWETLNSAERIGAFLDFAVAAERQETVTPKTLEFLYTLHGELRRLKWLTSKVK
jgi:hypothetical protein